MFHMFPHPNWLSVGRFAALLLLAAPVAGCANLDLRGEGFAKDETFDCARQYRKNDGHADLFGFSNKARQIERNCGAQ